jgi:hypothetical protein
MRGAVCRSWCVAGLALLAAVGRSAADDAVSLQEAPREGRVYRVSTRVDLSGTLTPPAEKGKPAPKPLAVKGDSAIDYDERLLTVADGQVRKTVRVYGRMDFQRTLGDRPQQSSLRPAVHRLVILRQDRAKAPFSPDGPLTWGEIDLVRTDVFTPALAGLLPDGPVHVGDRWPAAPSAVLELIDLDRIDDGKVECKLEEVTTRDKRRVAKVSFAGTVTGPNEDGGNRHQLDGYLLFDLESNHLSYLYLKGVHSLLDADGKEAGRIEGRFVLSRQADVDSREVSDEGLKGAALEPDAENSLLLYDNPDLGVKFLYPRRWKVAWVRGNQLALDGADGSGLLMTLEPPARTPTGEQYLAESRDWLKDRKAKILKAEPVKAVQASPPLEHFALEAEVEGQKVVLDYYVARQADGGATLAARLLPDDLDALKKEVERIARSVSVTKKIEERK